MKRFVVVTVGKTHSGKSTFAAALAERLGNALVIDQDNHAEFINSHYRALLPKTGPNTLKSAVTQTIVDYAVIRSNFHLILCNTNRAQGARAALLEAFETTGFTCILVNFEIPDEILAARVANTKRSKAAFRHASSFREVLARQQAEEKRGEVTAPIRDEAHHFFTVSSEMDVPKVIAEIVGLEPF